MGTQTRSRTAAPLPQLTPTQSEAEIASLLLHCNEEDMVKQEIKRNRLDSEASLATLSEMACREAALLYSSGSASEDENNRDLSGELYYTTGDSDRHGLSSRAAEFFKNRHVYDKRDQNEPIVISMTPEQVSFCNKDGRIGIYMPEERGFIIERYLSKRVSRQSTKTKTIRYACRKNLADSRMRIRGRFVRAEVAASMVPATDENGTRSPSPSISSSAGERSPSPGAAGNLGQQKRRSRARTHSFTESEYHFQSQPTSELDYYRSGSPHPHAQNNTMNENLPPSTPNQQVNGKQSILQMVNAELHGAHAYFGNASKNTGLIMPLHPTTGNNSQKSSSNKAAGKNAILPFVTIGAMKTSIAALPPSSIGNRKGKGKQYVSFTRHIPIPNSGTGVASPDVAGYVVSPSTIPQVSSNGARPASQGRKRSNSSV